MQEFQVIILAAGKGSRITEITARKPKCLLPIGNRPMVYYPLKMIERSGFKEVFLVVLESAKSEVEFILEKTDLSINIIFITVPHDTDWGTADSLRHISSSIISDFIVVSCDFLTTTDIKPVIDFHRKNDASVTALYFQLSTETQFTVPGPKSKIKTERDLVGIDPQTNRLVFVASASDYEEQLPLKRKLLQKHGRVRIYTKLLDAHLFIMKKWLIKYLTLDKSVSTVKGELVPLVLKKQMSRNNKILSANDSSAEVTPIKESTDKKNIDIFSFAKNIEYDQMARSMSSYNDHNGDLYPVYLNDNIRCYAFLNTENKFGIRTNTLHDYCKANKVIFNYWEDSEKTRISPEAEIKSTQLDKDTCFVGDYTKIAAKTFIKSSSIGNKCVIEQKTRIADCVIMNNVHIHEGCVLTNCIICDDVTIEANSNLKDSVVGSQYTILANSSHANEVLTEIESLMEV